MRLKNGGATTVTVSLKSRPSIQVSVQANAFYDLSKASVTSGFHTAYTGSPITFSPTVTYNGKTLTENTHYTISFSNNVNSGKASFEIKGLGLYQSTYNGTFIINKVSIQNTSIKLPYSSYAWSRETDYACPHRHLWGADTERRNGLHPLLEQQYG